MQNAKIEFIYIIYYILYIQIQLMVKNLIGGNKAKSMSNKKMNQCKIKLFKKPNEFEYIGKVIKELGSARFLVETYYDKSLHQINCSASRSIRIKLDDLILLTILREHKLTKLQQGEIVHKYNPENIADLRAFDSVYAKTEKRENIVDMLNKSCDKSFDMFSEDIKYDIDTKVDDIDINDI